MTTMPPSAYHVSAALLVAASLLAAPFQVAPSEARSIRGGHRVTVCSEHGRGCLEAPVRRGAKEWEVRMPGGTWIGCKRDCRRTLREEALDYFETLRDRVWDE